MNSNFEDTRLDERLRSYLLSQADQVAAMAADESEMIERVGARFARRHIDQRWILLAAAALLVALTAATAIAVGSGLLRWPWTSERITAAGGPSCSDYAPSATLVLDYSYQTAGVASPSGYVEMSLDTSGRLISGLSGASAGLTIRQLSPIGVQRMVALVRNGPFGSGCRTIDAGKVEHSVYVQSAAGVQGVLWGGSSGAFQLRPTSPAERSAALALQDRLDHVERWMPSDGWVDATPRPYHPDRWDVYVEWSPRQGGDPVGPDPSGFHMPDGSSLADYGTQLQVDPVYRCAVASTPFLNTLLARLADAHAPRQQAQGNRWVFTEAGGVNNVDVVINALRPQEPDCVEQASANPFVRISGSSDPLATAQPCDRLSDETMSSALGLGVHGESHLSMIGYRACVFYQGAFSRPGAGSQVANLDLRRQSTSDVEARQLTAELFGAATVWNLAGHRVYFNGCDRSALPCTPAIAIAAEPYFMVIDVNLPGKGDQATLEAIARAVIASLPPK